MTKKFTILFAFLEGFIITCAMIGGLDAFLRVVGRALY